VKKHKPVRRHKTRSNADYYDNRLTVLLYGQNHDAILKQWTFARTDVCRMNYGLLTPGERRVEQ